MGAQQRTWKERRTREDWKRVKADIEERRHAIQTPKVGRELCALVKELCPADQALEFERLLAACPEGTTTRQLIQSMAREPRDFRQNCDGSEFCVRPEHSRCVHWLPVDASTVPPGFCSDAPLPEEQVGKSEVPLVLGFHLGWRRDFRCSIVILGG